VDVSVLGPFQTATLLTSDSNTDPIHGPTPASVSLAGQIPVSFGGYGVVILTLK